MSIESGAADAAILKVLWVFPSFGKSARANDPAVARFLALAPRLGDDYEHVVCALDGDWSADAALPKKVKIEKLAVSLRRTGGVSLRNMWSVRKELAALKPGLIATHGWGSIDWLMVNRGPGAIPLVHFEDPIGDGDAADMDDASRAWGRRRAFPGRDRAFVAPTEALTSACAERWGAAADAVHLLPLGADVAALRRITRRLGNGRTVFGAFGPLTENRRHDRLLRLVATLRDRGRDAHALIVGEGPEKARLQQEVATLRLEERVSFGEKLDREAALARMDVFAITSDAEAAPAALPIAMGAGLPILSTDIGDVKAAIDPLNGLFVRPVSDESGLAAAAELLAADPELRKTLGAANRTRAAEALDHEVLARQLDSLFRQVSGASWRLLPAPAAEPKPARERPPTDTPAAA